MSRFAGYHVILLLTGVGIVMAQGLDGETKKWNNEVPCPPPPQPVLPPPPSPPAVPACSNPCHTCEDPCNSSPPPVPVYPPPSVPNTNDCPPPPYRYIFPPNTPGGSNPNYQYINPYEYYGKASVALPGFGFGGVVLLLLCVLSLFT